MNSKIFKDGDYLMKHGDFTCGFNMPAALKSKNNDEYVHGLPPYHKIKAFCVDDWPACPDNWLRSSGKTKSFFVPVKEGEGMWLDFNGCGSKYHVAVVISIQGINPVTGMMCSDFYMEQYKEKCPKHDIKFGVDRFCEKCGFKWPKQNYLCTTGTPVGSFWLDGFRTAEGVIRQYILTAEKMRGVAHNILGEEKVYAIGIAYFISKDPAPEKQIQYSLGEIWNNGFNEGGLYDTTSEPFYKSLKTIITCDTMKGSGGASCTNTNAYQDGTYLCAYNANSAMHTNSIRKRSFIGINKEQLKGVVSTQGLATTPIKETKKLEIGAGAKINQDVYDDPYELDFWRNDPEAILCINYVVEEDAIKILEAGKKERISDKDGFLKDMPVGN